MRKEMIRIAEVCAENYLISIGCQTRRAEKNVYRRKDGNWGSKKIDFFCADVMGKDGECNYYIQVTTGEHSAVTARRRKFEKVKWCQNDIVKIFQMIETPNPANKRKKMYHFRVHEYKLYSDGDKDLSWMWLNWKVAIEIPIEWFKVKKK